MRINPTYATSNEKFVLDYVECLQISYNPCS